MLAVKVDEAVRRELNVQLAQSTFWIDSMLVLQYINNTRKRFKIFVANCVEQIQSSTKVGQWNYVPSKQNPP